MNLGTWLAILSGALYGSLGLFGVYLLQAGLEINEFLFWRFLLSVVVLLPFLNTKQHWRDAFSKNGLLTIGISAVFYASATSFYFFAIKYIGSGLAILATVLPIYLVYVAMRTINSTKASILSVFEPIVTIILGIIFLQEKITIAQYIGVIIILGGVYIVQSCKKAKPVS